MFEIANILRENLVAELRFGAVPNLKFPLAGLTARVKGLELATEWKFISLFLITYIFHFTTLNLLKVGSHVK